MQKLNLPIELEEATRILLKKLPTRRMKDVVEKRYGLKGGKRKTLEAIGREYKITRERVRQIEADAMKHLSRVEHLQEIKPTLEVLEAHFQKDLGFDSLDAVDLLFAVNEHFGARIPEEMLSDINTVSNLVEIVDRQKKRSKF